MFPRKAYSLIQKWNEHTPHGTEVSQVYMLHEVYAPESAPRNPFCAVAQSRFLAWLDSLPASQISTPEQLSVPGTILLTFDDMFSSAFHNAIPALRQRKLPYTVFVAPGLLDQLDMISKDDLRKLADDPLCTIGAHSMSHCPMRPLSDEACLAELTESKRWLEAFTEREVWNFAFPYGSVYACSKSNQAQVESAGFRQGFSTLNRPVTAEDLAHPWFLPRRNINDKILEKKGL